ncbi:MAG: M56 family metallopeptidase [Planctomycetota bacterium]
MTSNVILTLETVGSQIWQRVIMGNLWAGVVLVAALVCDRLLGRRVAPAWRIALYLLVLARLVGPTDWSLPVGVWGKAPRSFASISYLNTQAGFAPLVGAATQADPATSGVPLTWRSGVAVSYGVGILLLTAMWIRGQMAIAHLARGSRPHSGSKGLVVSSHATVGPVLVGLIRPRLVVPEWLLESANAPALAHVIAHEKAHIRRFDPWLAALLHGACIAAWPIAAAWIAASRIRGLMEQAADARAAREIEGRVEYARTLLDVAQRASFTRLTPATLAFGGDVRSRIRTLASLTTHWPRGVQLAACGLLGLSTLACTTRQSTAPTAPAMVDSRDSRDAVTIEATLFNCKPSHPALTWQISTGPGESTPQTRRSVGTMTLTEAQFREIAGSLNGSKGQRIVSRPSVTMGSFSPAAITIGESASSDSPGHTLTLTHTPSAALPDRFVLSFAWKKGETVRTDIQDAELDIPPGGNRAILVTSLSGQDFNLLCLRRGGTAPVREFQSVPIDSKVQWKVAIHRVGPSITPKQVVMGDIRSMDEKGTVAILGNSSLARFNENLIRLNEHEIISTPSVVTLDRQTAKLEMTDPRDAGSAGGGYSIELTLSSGKAGVYAQIGWSFQSVPGKMTIAEWIDDNQSIIAIKPGADGSLYVMVATPTFTSPHPPAPAGR